MHGLCHESSWKEGKNTKSLLPPFLLVELLGDHIVPGVAAGQLVDGQELTTLVGNKVTMRLAEDGGVESFSVTRAEGRHLMVLQDEDWSLDSVKSGSSTTYLGWYL